MASPSQKNTTAERQTSLSRSLSFIRKYQSWVYNSNCTQIYHHVQNSILNRTTIDLICQYVWFLRNKYREIQIKVPEDPKGGTHIAFPSQWQYCAAVNIHWLFIHCWFSFFVPRGKKKKNLWLYRETFLGRSADKVWIIFLKTTRRLWQRSDERTSRETLRSVSCWHGLDFQGHRWGSRHKRLEDWVLRWRGGRGCLTQPFRDRSQSAHWCWESAVCGWAPGLNTPFLPPAGCRNSVLLPRRCGCWRPGPHCRRPAQKSGRRRRWRCASGWWELRPSAPTGWKWVSVACQPTLSFRWWPFLSLAGSRPCPCLCCSASRIDISSWPWPPGLTWWHCG